MNHMQLHAQHIYTIDERKIVMCVGSAWVGKPGPTNLVGLTLEVYNTNVCFTAVFKVITCKRDAQLLPRIQPTLGKAFSC